MKFSTVTYATAASIAALTVAVPASLIYFDGQSKKLGLDLLSTEDRADEQATANLQSGGEQARANKPVSKTEEKVVLVSPPRTEPEAAEAEADISAPPPAPATTESKDADLRVANVRSEKPRGRNRRGWAAPSTCPMGEWRPASRQASLRRPTALDW